MVEGGPSGFSGACPGVRGDIYMGFGEVVSGGKEQNGEEMGRLLILRKGMSFKGKTATRETEPCPRLYETTEQTSRTGPEIRSNDSKRVKVRGP